MRLIDYVEKVLGRNVDRFLGCVNVINLDNIIYYCGTKGCYACWNQEITLPAKTTSSKKNCYGGDIFERKECNTCRHFNLHRLNNDVNEVLLQCKGRTINYQDWCEGWNK
jgi:hypothetical protein